MKVVKIGGCNGSGKTSLVRAIIEDNNLQPQYAGRKVECYTGKLPDGSPVVVLGSYANACGGMDTISDKEDRLALIQKYLNWGDVRSTTRRAGVIIFEGLITGKTYGAIGEISDRKDQHGNWVYVFMDTPFDVCVKRVLKRRATKHMEKTKGQGKVVDNFDPERTMRPTFKSCLSVRRKAIESDHWVYDVDHKLSAGTAAGQLVAYIIDSK